MIRATGNTKMFKRHPWLWILVGFLAYVILWFGFIRFAKDHSPPEYDPANPPQRILDAP